MFQFLAQVFHLRVDEVQRVSLVDVVAPDGFGQAHLVDDAVGVGHEVVEQVILLAVELEGRAVHLHQVLVRVEGEVAQGDGQVALRYAASDEGLDAGVQLGQVEGFGQIVVRAQFEAIHLVVQRILGGDDEHAVVALEAFQLAQEVEPASARQHDVQQDAVVVVVVHLVQRREVVGGSLYHEFLFL